MKVYISADIEGVTGIGHWDETSKRTQSEYQWFQKQMTREVAAAAQSALAAGATHIVIKDAHDSGRNLLLEELPEEVELIRGWAGHPLSMVQELDDSFDAVMFIGYHSRAGQDSNPLAHTMSSARIARMRLNDKDMSEFYLHGLAASYYGVPSIFVSGDQGLCDEVAEHNENIETVATIRGEGNSIISQHPEKSLIQIRDGVTKALNKDMSKCLLDLPEEYDFRIEFKKHQDTYRASFYPGAKKLSPLIVQYKTTDFFEVLRFNLLAY